MINSDNMSCLTSDPLRRLFLFLILVGEKKKLRQGMNEKVKQKEKGTFLFNRCIEFLPVFVCFRQFLPSSKRMKLIF